MKVSINKDKAIGCFVLSRGLEEDMVYIVLELHIFGSLGEGKWILIPGIFMIKLLWYNFLKIKRQFEYP